MSGHEKQHTTLINANAATQSVAIDVYKGLSENPGGKWDIRDWELARKPSIYETIPNS